MHASRLRIFIISLICISCTSDKGPLQTLFSFPESLSEVSAIEVTNNPQQIWALQDSGNSAELYQLDQKGNLLSTVSVDAENNDWEALASDDEGNLYIGDFGNNDNDRRDLCIYKVDAENLKKKNALVSRKIEFYYPEQKDFPAKKSERVFDAEAFFYYDGNFYLFTKNRSSKFDGTTTLYKVPNKEGRHEAKAIGTFKACAAFKQCAITGADISPDHKKVVLITGSKVYLFENFSGDRFFDGESTEIDLEHFSQKEGICFSTNSTVFIADEKSKKTGGNLYQLNLQD